MTGSIRKAVLLNDTTVDRHHGCTTVIESIRKLADATGILLTATAPAHSNWQQNPGFLSAFDDCDLVIVNGEGTLHHDRPAARTLLLAGSRARAQGKKAALINATWQANSAEACDLAKTFHLISVRESASQVELAANGIDARVVADLALYHQPPRLAKRDGISFTDSVIGTDGLEIYKQMWRAGAKPISLLHGRKSIRDSLTSLRRFLGVQGDTAIRNLPYALRGVGTDWRAQVADRDDFASRVARSSLVVTGRFHMLIFCLATRTPFLAVESNTHKISSTLADVGLQEWRLASPMELMPESLDRASHWHAGEIEAIDRFVASNRLKMMALFRDMHQL